MKRFFRPLGLLSGAAARQAVAEGHALLLAGGPLAFALVERIERDAKGGIARSVEPAPPLRSELARHSEPRNPIHNLSFDHPHIMGIVNATPDSFSDGGDHFDPSRAVAHAKTMIGAGAEIVDVGGESTRPGADPIDPAEEIRRIRPILEQLSSEPGAVLSVDTRNAVTIRAALAAGASLINDVSALTNDPDSLAVVAEAGAPVVLMHMQGEPRTMQHTPAYADAALDIYEYLEARIEACEAAGIPRARIIADPGIGFGKTVTHNLTLLDQLALFHGLGVPLMVGVSRKGFIGRLSNGEPSDRRLPGSIAAGLAAIGQGVQILRMHDVVETAQALRVWTAIQAGRA